MRWLGIDYGDVRIGVALSDELTSFAHPFRTLANDGKTLEELQSIVKQEKVGGIVIGLPRNMNGTFGPAADKVREFERRLQTALPGVKIALWDERLTTTEAQRMLHASGKNTRQSRKMIDRVAAQILLQSYLDRLQSIAG